MTGLGSGLPVLQGGRASIEQSKVIGNDKEAVRIVIMTVTI